jgi:hypothetical protein
MSIAAQMMEHADQRKYEAAALAALELADLNSVRSAEGAQIYTTRALVYATLHQADIAQYALDHARERMP